MRRGTQLRVLAIVVAMLVVVPTMPAAAKLSAKDKRTARTRVYNAWSECLAAEGITFEDVQAAKVRSTSSAETGHPIDSASIVLSL